MDYQGIFKNAMFGFKKADVLSYINSMNQKNSALEAELQGKISSMVEENAGLLTAIKERDQKIEEMTGTLSETQEKLEVITEELTTERQRSLEKDSRIQSLNKEIVSFNMEKESIAQAILQAQNTATQIVSDGRNQAGEVKAKAKVELAATMKELGALQDELSHVGGVLDHIIGDIKDKVDVVSGMLEHTKRKVEANLGDDTTAQKSEPKAEVKSTDSDFFRSAAAGSKIHE